MVVCAAPNAALRDVAVANERLFDEFAGLIILTGADSPDAQLHARLAAAVTVRVVPILLPGDDRILCLALAPRKGGARWAQAKAWLDTLGEVVVVEDPQIYREIMVLTSPLAAVLRTALTSALSRFLDQRPGGAALQHQGFDAASLALTGRTGSLGPASTRHDARIATPGGLTEAGLQHADALSDALLTAIASMRRRADALDRPQIEPGDGHGPR
jgi:pyrroline-5-carboxylate reductase